MEHKSDLDDSSFALTVEGTGGPVHTIRVCTLHDSVCSCDCILRLLEECLHHCMSALFSFSSSVYRI